MKNKIKFLMIISFTAIMSMQCGKKKGETAEGATEDTAQVEESKPVVGKVKGHTVTASSVLIEEKKSADFYGPAKVADQNYATSWCTNKNGGVGESIEVKFKGTKHGNGIAIMGGFAKSKGLFKNNSRVKDYELAVTMDNGNSQKISGTLNQKCWGAEEAKNTCAFIDEDLQALDSYKKYGVTDRESCEKIFQKYCRVGYVDDPSQDYQWGNDEQIPLPSSVNITSVKLTIKSVHKGAKYTDLCVANIDVYQQESY